MSVDVTQENQAVPLAYHPVVEQPNKKRPYEMVGTERDDFPPPLTPHTRSLSLGKRQRVGHHDVRHDMGPLPPPAFAMLPPPQLAPRGRSSPTWTSGRSSPTKTGSSRLSRASAPLKNVGKMIFRPRTIESKTFVNPGRGVELPHALAEMPSYVASLGLMERAGRGCVYVSCQKLTPVLLAFFFAQEEIGQMDDEFRSKFFDAAFDATGKRDTFGPSPSPLAVKRIVKRASRFQENGCSEPAWFSLVHSHLLTLALDNDFWDEAIDVVPW